MKFISSVFAALTAIAVLAGCGGKDEPVDTSVFEVTDGSGKALSDITVPAEGKSLTCTIKANIDWTITSPDWISVSQKSGSSGTTVLLSVNQNMVESPRNGSVAFSSAKATYKFSVTQEAKTPDPVFEVTFSDGSALKDLETVAASSVLTLTVKANNAWDIVAPDWITADPASGSADANVTLKISANSSETSRSSEVAFRSTKATLSFKISQAGKEPDPIFEVTASDGSAVKDIEVEAAASSLAYSVKSNMEWTVTGPDWITLSPASGNADATVILKVSANSVQSARSGEVTFSSSKANYKFVVSQKAKEPDPVFTVTTSEGKTPSNVTVAAEGTSLSYTIKSNQTWTVSAPSWAELSASSGSNDGTVTITVPENTNAEARSGEVTFTSPSGAVKFTLTQSGKEPEKVFKVYSVTGSTYTEISEAGKATVIAKGQEINYLVKASVAWTVTAPSWASATPASGKEEALVKVTVRENTSAESRNGEITFSSELGTVKVTLIQTAAGGTGAGAGDPYTPTPFSIKTSAKK